MHCCRKPEFIPDSEGRRGNRSTTTKVSNASGLLYRLSTKQIEPQLKQGSPPLKVSALTHLNKMRLTQKRGGVNRQVGFQSMPDASPFCARVHSLISLTLSLQLFLSDGGSLAHSPDLLHGFVPAFRPRSSLLTGYRALGGVQGH